MDVYSEEDITDGLRIAWTDAELTRVTVKPGDMLVLMVPPGRWFRGSSLENIRASLRARYPENDVVILEDGLRLGVLSPVLF